MGWRCRYLGAVMGVMLICAGIASAETAQPPAVQLPKGIYESRLITQGDPPADSPAASPTSQPSVAFASSPHIDLGRLSLAMGIVLGLIFLMRWAGYRFFPGAGVLRSGGAMKVLSRLVISPKQQLLMIQVGRRIVVVGDAGGQMSPLSEITDPEETSAMLLQLAEERSHHTIKGFGSLFHRAETTLEEKITTEQSKPSAADLPSAPDPAIDNARGEISDLADKLRLLSAQFSGK
jgi:flagellar protein FliO/FliZ